MKIGISAFAWTSRLTLSHLELLPAIKQMGFDSVEIPMFDPATLPIGALRTALEANALECSICAILPPDINPISPERQARRKAAEHLRHCIEAARALNAKLLGGPLVAPIGYLPHHRPTQDEWLWAAEVFQSAGDLLKASG